MKHEIRNQRSHCKETDQSVTITSHGLIDESADIFIPNKHECSHQGTCEIYFKNIGQHKVCPLVDQIHKKYEAMLM
jgi:hypothetical protein